MLWQPQEVSTKAGRASKLEQQLSSNRLRDAFTLKHWQ